MPHRPPLGSVPARRATSLTTLALTGWVAAAGAAGLVAPMPAAAATSATPAAAATPAPTPACPADTQPRPPGTLLSVQGAPRGPWALDEAAFAALPATRLTQSQRLSATPATGTAGATAAPTPVQEQQVTWQGVLLRDLLLQAGHGTPQDRGARVTVVEAVATDGYRAFFSWGELFNAPAGEQVLVIRARDGQPLDAAAGPLALRALGDQRPGPRHIRNLCLLRVRALD